MNTSQPPTNGNKRWRRWFRRGHRWIGLSLVVFVVYLSVSGIVLNHAGDLRLESRYVSWSWLLDAYGLKVPDPAATFSDLGHRSSLLGERLFLDGHDTGQRESTLTGIAALGPLVVIGGERHVYLFMADGEFVEAIDLGATLNASLESVGRAGDRAVVKSGGRLYRSDADVAMFASWEDGIVDHWSSQTSPSLEERQVLEAAWRGKGVTVERLMLDLHSGRLFGKAGPFFMDLVAILLILLSLSGLVMYKVRNRRK